MLGVLLSVFGVRCLLAGRVWCFFKDLSVVRCSVFGVGCVSCVVRCLLFAVC